MAQARAAVVGVAQRITTTRAGAWAMLIVSNAIFAGAYAAGKIALRDISPIMLNALRFSIAALFLLPIVIAGRRRLRFPLRMLPRFIPLVLLGFVLNKLFEYIGLSLTTASDTALLISTESIFTAIFSWVILRERFSRVALAALVIGFLGVYLIIEQSLIPHLDTSASASLRVLGDLLVILSLVFEAGYTVSGKALLDRYPPLLITSFAIIGSLLFWLPAGGAEVLRTGWPRLPLEGWLGVLYLGIAVTVGGYFLWFQGLTQVDASSAAPFLFIQPLLGAALAILLLGEQLTWATAAGGALIVVSVLLVARRKPLKLEQPLET